MPLVRSENGLSHSDRQEFINWLARNDAKLLAHYYTPAETQELALESGGIVADSLEMARFGQQQDASVLVVAGVRFMAETAKILNPEKRVLIPADQATCSLDLGCPVDEFKRFCAQYPDREVVVYANTSAAVKAQADWVVTSRIALEVVEHLAGQGKEILWAPDKHLGDYIRRQTGIDMVLWDGACIVHEEFKAEGIRNMRQVYPDAAVIAHPESPRAVLDEAQAVGSTSYLESAARDLPQSTIIVATDAGFFHTLRRNIPNKEFLQAPVQGEGATCRSCGRCPWMAMNTGQQMMALLSDQIAPIELDPEICRQAAIPLQRMVDFKLRAPPDNNSL
ncbi:MAG: quinolinate synthase NadA [Gammaproteobacteria bacterium]